MKLLYKKLGTVKKPDGTDFNIYGFNQMPYAEYILKAGCSEYTRNGWMKIKGTDGVTYFVPMSARSYSITDKEYKDRKLGESRLRTPWKDDYLDCLDWSTEWEDILSSNSITLSTSVSTDQTKESLGYGKYRYTNVYTVKTQLIVNGSIPFDTWMQTFWPSSTINMTVYFMGVTKHITGSYNVLTDSAWKETNTTGSTYPSKDCVIICYPDLNIQYYNTEESMWVNTFLRTDSIGGYKPYNTNTITLKRFCGYE